MTTITIKSAKKLKKTEFNSVEDFQLYLLEIQENSELNISHKNLLDKRLLDLEDNPNDFMSLDKLKSSIKRK
jgi:hypothetical protein